MLCAIPQSDVFAVPVRQHLVRQIEHRFEHPATPHGDDAIPDASSTEFDPQHATDWTVAIAVEAPDDENQEAEDFGLHEAEFAIQNDARLDSEHSVVSNPKFVTDSVVTVVRCHSERVGAYGERIGSVFQRFHIVGQTDKPRMVAVQAPCELERLNG